MIKQYQCKSCGLMFEAEDAGSVTCPHCHSGNVVEVMQKSHTKTIVIAAVAAVVVVLGVILAVKLVRGPSAPTGTRADATEMEQGRVIPDEEPVPDVTSPAQNEQERSGNAYADSVAAAKEHADSMARAEAEAERQAKEEAARKAREEAAKKPAIEKISVAGVQSMLQAYLNGGSIGAFRTQQFASRNPHVKCNESSVNAVSDLLDYKNIVGEVSFTVTDLEYNADNQVTAISLRIN